MNAKKSLTLLAPYAVHESQGREYQEVFASQRHDFERDRDRIIHCVAFRRLEYKTQVFAHDEGDLFRTRLTHTLEVAQIARSMARRLNLNEDLAEAIALAHDLGHTPFGHAGQDALNIAMKNDGGFEHNLHGLRIVDKLEQRYAKFDGLNLSYETREGILKHCSLKNAQQLGVLGQRFINRQQASLEAQLVDYADEIAYNHHDIDDALRAGLIRFEELESLPLWSAMKHDVLRRHPQVQGRRLIAEIIREMMSAFISDLLQTTNQNIKRYQPSDLAAVRLHTQPFCAFSASMQQERVAMKRFLFASVYCHPAIQKMNYRAHDIVQGLFDVFANDPQLLPLDYQASARSEQPRLIADYIAGMTDRYAIKAYQGLVT